MSLSLSFHVTSAVVLAALGIVEPSGAQQVKETQASQEAKVSAGVPSELANDLLPQGDPVFKLENCASGSWLMVSEVPQEGTQLLIDKLGIQPTTNAEGRRVAYLIGTYRVTGEDTSRMKDWAQWKIIRGHGQSEGLFKFENTESGGSIFVRKFELPLEASDRDSQFLRETQGRAPYLILDHRYENPGGKPGGDHPWHWWRIIEGEGAKIGCFRIENASSEVWLSPEIPLLLCAAGGSACSKDEEKAFWRFRFSDMEVIGVEYFFDRAQLSVQKPLVVGDLCLNNTQSTVEQHQELKIDHTVEHTSSFQHERGIEIATGLEFSVGIATTVGFGGKKFGAEVTASADMTTSFGLTEKMQHVWGSEVKHSVTYESSFPLTAPPGKCSLGTATVRRGTLKVPYKLILKVAGGTGTIASYGTWTGVTTWSLGFLTGELGPEEMCPC